MEEIARSIFENALMVNFRRPFRWRSGLKAPVYTDTRMLLSVPQARTQIVGKITEIIRREFSDVQRICGIATGGLPWAAMAAQSLDLPLMYVRSGGTKNHGTGKSVEGILEKGDRVVLIEDTVSTGGAVLAAAQILRKYEAVPTGVISVFSYAFAGVSDKFRSRSMRFFPVVEFPAVVRAAAQHGNMTPSELESLRNWHVDPKKWKPGTIFSF